MRSAPVRIALWTCVAIAACEGSHRAPRDRFIPVADGVVLDSRTHLEWTSGDYAQSLAWDDADRLCRGSSRGGRTGWRLPQIGELQALYDERFDELCGDRHCHLDPAVRLGGPYVWSVSTRGGGTRFYFDFGFGTSLSPSIGPTLVRRVLCVHDVSTSTSVSDVPATPYVACSSNPEAYQALPARCSMLRESAFPRTTADGYRGGPRGA